MMNLHVLITQHLGAYDLDIHELPKKLHVIRFSSVFKEKQTISLLSSFQDLNNVFGLNMLSHFRNGNEPICGLFRHIIVLVCRLS